MKDHKMTYLKHIVTSILLSILVIAGTSLTAQNENKLIRKGNNAFEEGDYQKAEIDYRKALEKNQESVKGEFNLGGAMYQQERFEEAAKKFESLSGENLPPEIKAGSYHNLGNAYMGMNEYEQAIEAYKNALRNNPGDANTKYNLEYAKRMLRHQQQQQQQNQDQNQKNQEDQQQKQDQQQEQKQQKDQEEQNQQQQNQQQQNQQQNQDQQQQQQQPQQKQISKEDAERMLQALKDNEKKTLEKIKLEKLKNAKRVKSEKDW